MLLKATPANIKQKIGAWKNTPPDEGTVIIYSTEEIDTPNNEIIRLGFENNIVINVEPFYGKLNKVVYIGALT